MTDTRLIKDDSFVVVIDNGVDEPLLGIGETEEAALNDADQDGEYRKKGYSVELRYCHAEHFYSVRLSERGLGWNWNDDYLCPVYDDELRKQLIVATLLRKYKVKAERSKRHEQHKIKTI